ncbi:chemotaxis protein CheB, partial [Rhizobium brockwellii]|uniref:chemotaxis protein CheB n=2 Tax=Alphaproteobacteria TaxID=28211 RepID=UPI003F9900BD
IRGGVLELTDFVQPRGLRRPIDDFFLSLASDQQANAACVILSGTGADGTTGLRAIKENGGVSVVQKPETARYDGMPLSAVGTGL